MDELEKKLALLISDIDIIDEDELKLNGILLRTFIKICEMPQNEGQ